MHELYTIFSNYSWIVSSKPIYTAAIPVLKLEINPAIAFDGNDFYSQLNMHPH